MKSSKSNSCGLNLIVVEKGQKQGYVELEGVTVAEIGREITFNPTILDSYNFEGWKPVHHDLLIVCAAVEFADRRRQRCTTQWHRPFHITVPVWELEHWQQPEVRSLLIDTLRHLTGDDWHFSFVQAMSLGPNEDRQRSFSFGNKEFAIAYSDGLDSRCVSGIYDQGNIAVRIRVSKTNDNCIRGAEHPFDLRSVRF